MPDEGEDGSCAQQQQASPAVARQTCDAPDEDALMAYPAGGYWGLSPDIRLRMLRALCHDALATGPIRWPASSVLLIKL